MPFYEFDCNACQATFDMMVPMDARDRKVACPKCGSHKTGRKLSVVSVGAAATSGDAASHGHAHSSMCGCGKPMGSCGMN